MAVVELLPFFLTITISMLPIHGGVTVTGALPPLPSPPPALYVFGDSYLDAGNNNFLPTKLRANYLPYGIDFGRVPTGRASNGKTVVDFVAQAASLPLPPPMLGMSEAEQARTVTGVNYASGGGGILPAPREAERLFGHVLSLGEQVDLFFKNTTEALKNQFDDEESFAFYLSKSLFFLHAGSNDLGLFWDFDINSTAQQRYARLLSELSKQLKVLHQLGARKFIVNNVSPLGCLPFFITTKSNGSSHSGCFEELNLKVSAFNRLLQTMLSNMELSLPGSKFYLGDIFGLLEDVFSSPGTYGILNIRDSCCIDVSRKGPGPCAPGLDPCPDRATYAFFDPFHVTEAMHLIWGRSVISQL